VREKRALTSVLACVAILLGGCSEPGDETPQTTAETARPKNPLLEDRGIRPVRMATGQALTWVAPETASQILCQTLDKEQWKDLLGGEVGRLAGGAPSAGCVITSAASSVTVELFQAHEALDPEFTVGGRPAANDRAQIRVALTDDALAPTLNKGARSVLTITVNQPPDLDTAATRELQTRVLTELVPPLAERSEAVPVLDDLGTVAYVSTPLAPGGEIVDLPTPIQALQLCTVLRERLGLTRRSPEADKITSDCEVSLPDGDNVTAYLRHTNHRDEYPEHIASRPARRLKLESGTESITVLLRDGAEVGLTVTAPDAASIAEQLVPILLG